MLIIARIGAYHQHRVKISGECSFYVELVVLIGYKRKLLQKRLTVKKLNYFFTAELDNTLKEEMDKCIQEAFLTGADEAFSQMMYLIMSENVSPDYQVRIYLSMYVCMYLFMHVCT